MSWGGRAAQRWLTYLLATRPHVCVVCLLPIDARLRGTRDVMRPSVEHLRARSLGGTDTEDNMGLAHLSCNSSRGNRTRSRPVVVNAAFFGGSAPGHPAPASISPRER